MKKKHNGPYPIPLKDRIQRNILILEDGCWIWMGALIMPGGYGLITMSGGRTTCAHRVSYETYVGPIPAGLTIDHLCRIPACVNPAHLEAVTLRENILRSDSPGCRRAYNRRRYHAQKVKATL